MDALDHVRAREHEQVVVALQVARVVGEALAAEVGLGEPVPLDHRAHRAVEHEDALAQQGGERRRRWLEASRSPPAVAASPYPNLKIRQ